MNRKELIKKYLNFFKKKEHKVIENASLIPKDDPTVLFTTAGMHPHEAKDFNNNTYTALKKLSNHPKVVAIGEIGLDFYRNLSPHKVQEQVFRDMISLGREEKLPVIIHSSFSYGCRPYL